MTEVNYDYTHLTDDEKLNGIGATKIPKRIRTSGYVSDFAESVAQLAELLIQALMNKGLDPDEALEWARKLQESVSQSEFDSWVATLLDGGPSIFMNTLNELKATYPNGAAGVALVRETDPAKIYVWNGTAWEDFGDYQGIEVKDGSITSSKLSEGAVTPDKVTFVTTGNNLFDRSARIPGVRINGDGTFASDSSFSVSNKIPASAGDTFSGDIIYSANWYDKDSNMIKQDVFTGGEERNAKFTAPERAYVLIVVTNYDASVTMVNKGDTLLPFEPYKLFLDEKFEIHNDIKEISSAVDDWLGFLTETGTFWEVV